MKMDKIVEIIERAKKVAIQKKQLMVVYYYRRKWYSLTEKFAMCRWVDFRSVKVKRPLAIVKVIITKKGHITQ